MGATSLIPRNAAAALAALVLAGCGGAEPGIRVRDTAVVVRSGAAFTRSADFPARVEATLAAALDYWGGSWDHLAGITITLEGAAQVDCAGLGPSAGCFDGDIRVSTMDAGRDVACVEATVLAHEVGHAVVGDAGHLDPRWMDFDALAAALDGRAGYSDAGPAACIPAPAVWRHPALR